MGRMMCWQSFSLSSASIIDSLSRYKSDRQHPLPHFLLQLVGFLAHHFIRLLLKQPFGSVLRAIQEAGSKNLVVEKGCASYQTKRHVHLVVQNISENNR